MASWNAFQLIVGAILLLLQPCGAQGRLDVFERARQQGVRQALAMSGLQNASIAECNSPTCFRYYNSKTKPYFIESWPEVDFDTGEFYGGSVPINESDPSRTLFFIFKPAQGPPVDEVTIWLQGGPGASSLGGFLQENGPILWQPGEHRPRRNWFAWSKATNMLWVESPVGVGFTQGKAEAKNEYGVAKEFAGFFQNWEKLFGIENYKIYLTGESYAGKYIPYFGAHMLDLKDKTHFDFSGALMYDPCIGDCGYVQTEVPWYQFAKANNEILNLDPKTLAKMEKMSVDCGYEAYIEKYLQFPPSGVQPYHKLYSNLSKIDACNMYPLYSEAIHKNPCWNPYHIIDYCPYLWDVVTDPFTQRYFNRTDVKQAIHAPVNVDWYYDGGPGVSRAVFADHSYDAVAEPIDAVLPQIIEATNRVLVSNADYDTNIFTNGTLMAIQNMKWNGKLGFQERPSQDFVVPFSDQVHSFAKQGIMGKQHYERGLQWVESYQSGHQQPQYQPAATYRHLEWMLGRIDSL